LHIRSDAEEGGGMTQEEIIAELFKARVTQRIGRVDLATMCGHHESQILRTELGQVSPRQTKLQLVCDVADALGYELALVKK
jgi:predicted transcriptional regulator